MHRLIDIYNKQDYMLKIYEYDNKLRGKLYHKKKRLSTADFYGREAQVYRVKEYFGF